MKPGPLFLHQSSTSNPYRRSWLTFIFAATLALAVVMAACGGDEEPPDAGDESRPGTHSESGTESEAASSSSLEEYVSACIETGDETEESVEDLPIEEFSEILGDIINRLEADTPPAEVADWHNAILAYHRGIKDSIDEFSGSGVGQSEEEFILTILFPLALEYQPAIDAAISGMDPAVRSRMVSAGCIEDETVGEVPSEGTGPVPPEREEILEGSSVAGSLDDPDETDRFQFQAEAGDDYLIAVTWEDMPRLMLSLFQPPGYNWTFDSRISPISERWTPDVSGTVNISVSAGDATGAYVLSISADPSPETPANVTISWEGSGARLTWDPVAGAEYYNVYHDDFFSTSCSIDPDGNPSRCQELADNVVDTIYLIPSAGTDENFYWVAACNSEGCSQVDTESPATLTADQPGGPRSGGPCRLGDFQPGDSCFVAAPGGQTGASIFEVRDGEACYGDICGEESIFLDEFLAYASRDGSWYINRLPEGAVIGGDKVGHAGGLTD